MQSFRNDHLALTRWGVNSRVWGHISGNYVANPLRIFCLQHDVQPPPLFISDSCFGRPQKSRECLGTCFGRSTAPSQKVLETPPREHPSKQATPCVTLRRHFGHVGEPWRDRINCELLDLPATWVFGKQAQNLRVANRGFRSWGFPDLDSRFVLFLSFLRTFPIYRGFSRFALSLFLGLLQGPTRTIPEKVRDTIGTFPETPRFGTPPV